MKPTGILLPDRLSLLMHTTTDDIKGHTMPPKDSDDWKAAGFRWLSQQGVSTVLLFAILASGWYAIPWLANTVVPAHTASIKAGYEALEQSHRSEREDRDKRFVSEREKDREMFRDWLNLRKTVSLPGDPLIGQ